MEKRESNIKQTITYNESKKEDSLRNPFHESYLSDVPLRKVGQLVLSDSIQPLDNNITFQLMDSINSNNKETRSFYYSVFRKIVSKADGALSEIIGGYVMNYAGKFPDEFFNRYDRCNFEQSCLNEFDQLAGDVQYAIGMQTNIDEALNDFIKSINKGRRKYPEDSLVIRFVNIIKKDLESYKE